MIYLILQIAIIKHILWYRVNNLLPSHPAVTNKLCILSYSKHCIALRHAHCVTTWTSLVHKKGFNIDYTRDLSTMQKEESIAVWSTAQLPLKYKVSIKS